MQSYIDAYKRANDDYMEMRISGLACDCGGNSTLNGSIKYDILYLIDPTTPLNNADQRGTIYFVETGMENDS